MKTVLNIFFSFFMFMLLTGCSDSKTVSETLDSPVAHKINKQHVDNISFDDNIEYHINNSAEFLELTVKNLYNNQIPTYHIDIDNNINSGYSIVNGSEYLIEYNNLFRYSGDGQNWSWEYVSTLDVVYLDGAITIKVPKQMLADLGDSFHSVLFLLDQNWNMLGQTSNVPYTIVEQEQDIYDYTLRNGDKIVGVENSFNFLQFIHPFYIENPHIIYFIDNDNNSQTGDENGYDYIVQDDKIYNYTWQIVGNVSFEIQENKFITTISKDAIDFGDDIKVSAQIMDENWVWKYYVSGIVPIVQGNNNNIDRTKKIFIIGDSTVKNPTDIGVGWGERLAQYAVNPENVYNLAQSGTSSKSYREQDWRMTKEFMASKNIQNGAYLLIQFGHNDETDEEYEMYMKTYPGVGNSFYNELKNYVVEAREMGITPVLITPVERMEKTAGWELNHTHIKPEGDYAQTVRDLSQNEGVLLLDLQDKSWREFNTYRDKEELISIFGYGEDNSHFNYYGAGVVAGWVKELICTTGDQTFCAQFR